ncbi:hypothetical protein PHYBLDRAFT_61624 [Phycomyces blakesleeanus NRRL 1555(-)]|uniref:Uncharacterized protein n=1 Tax=Phycomyces blakesleeanus (strain ATCC 8743b / DSM 1359 / FGSC 10004 / NBRC 33097 / NRRL 1555) TaxID=763407 RepID=A0A162V7C4_PHYB8|nr:hypothetical protein PHYBLDRAFT_61624 [Phycomyces blakesleeanus NRRL 1555(-)]OAD80573.1 hypothetical protein PHYBLDRAFT_61624 [Phycomyces blakesleeanus NRRL 1555(-)]|eukprot:XP_018298613.1 hypothetical protein PHYBLDRAFT_61624 [Phycomyces blakesleeanus NRRL 1555(-)]
MTVTQEKITEPFFSVHVLVLHTILGAMLQLEMSFCDSHNHLTLLRFFTSERYLAQEFSVFLQTKYKVSSYSAEFFIRYSINIKTNHYEAAGSDKIVVDEATVLK